MIFTKRGDGGKSSIMNSEPIFKDEFIFDVLGTVDELSANLGAAKAIGSSKVKDAVQSIQRELVSAAACFAGNGDFDFDRAAELMERDILSLKPYCMDIGSFALCGKNHCSAQLDVARTVCRRLERLVVKYVREEGKHEASIAYFNRLSDYLFVIARAAEEENV